MAEAFERASRFCLGELYSGEGRCRVESEAVLPDYKEAVYRILRVQAKAAVNRKNLYSEGQNLVCEVEGNVNFHLLYLTERDGEKGIPSSFSVSEPFTYTFKAPISSPIDTDRIAILLEPRCENVFFKLQGPRKIGMRCELRLELCLKHNETFFVTPESLPEDVCLKKREMRVASLSGLVQEEIGFSETISLPKAYPAIGEICEMDADLFCKRITRNKDGVRISGNCDLRCSYVAEGEENLVSFYQPVDFEKSISLPDLPEDAEFCLDLSPISLRATSDVNEEGENKNVFFEISFEALLRAYENELVSVAEDAFSEKSHLEVETEERSLVELCCTADFSQTVRDSLPQGDREISSCEGLRWSWDFKDSYLEDKNVVLCGKLDFSFLSEDGEGELSNYEKSCDFKVKLQNEIHGIPDSAADLRIEVIGGVRALDVDPNSGKLEMRYEICGRIMVFCRHSLKSVLLKERGEDREEEKRGILFAYTKKGDDLWTLAKTHHVSPQKLAAQNAIAENDPLPSVVYVIR